MEKNGVVFDASWLEKRKEEEASFSERRVVCRAGIPPSTSGKKLFFRSKPIRWLANSLILASLIGLLFIFGPVLRVELAYRAKQVLKGVNQPIRTTFGDLLKLPAPAQALAAPNASFSLVIPKIEAKAPVFANIDAGNPKEFSRVLSQGVAHAKGTFFPGMGEVIYLFAHSTDSPFNVARYNAVFFLLRELEPGDEIILFFQGKRLPYRVFEKTITAPNDTSFFEPQGEEILVLQTCWPPGTTLRRLLVLAKPST
jgi:LPXTG-site transpeptidase (sortase) family protein